MPRVPTKLQAEAKFRRALRLELRPEATLVRAADRLIYRAMQLAPQPVPARHPIKAQGILLARLSNDLSSGLLLAQRGYLLQVWTMTSTLFEHAFCVGMIGSSEERADKWFSHDQWNNTPWGVSASIKHTLAYLELPARQHAELYHRYQQMCAAKHANPVIQQHFGVTANEAMTRIQLDPRFVRGHLPLYRLGLNYALQAVGIAVWVFAKERISDARFNDMLQIFAARVVALHGVRRSGPDLPAVN